jgi:hypothetical protein
VHRWNYISAVANFNELQLQFELVDTGEHLSVLDKLVFAQHFIIQFLLQDNISCSSIQEKLSRRAVHRWNYIPAVANFTELQLYVKLVDTL